MLTKSEKRKVLTIHNEKVSRRSNEVQIALPILQKVLDEYTLLGRPHITSTDALKVLISEGGTTFIKNQLKRDIEKEKPSFGGLPVDPDRAISLVALPDFGMLDEACFKAQSHTVAVQYCELRGKQIQLKRGAEDMIREECTVYCFDEIEAELADAHQAAAESLERLRVACERAAGFSIINHNTPLSTIFQLSWDPVNPVPITTSERLYSSLSSGMNKRKEKLK